MKSSVNQVSVPDAQKLAADDPTHFQYWALGLVDARHVEERRGADRGIDGRLYFHTDKGKTQQIIFSVKAGQNINVAHVRDLRGVIEREKAAIGVLITMEEPTKPMTKEAAEAGFYKVNRPSISAHILAFRFLPSSNS